MNTIERREKLKAQLKDKKYRDAFVSAHIDEGISFQIRALRKKMGWTQKELSGQTGMAQERISVAENPNYSRFNIKTLKRIASSFNVALIVRFVPISELVKWELTLSSKTLAPMSFDEDPYFKETPQQAYDMVYSQPEPTISSYVGSGGYCLGGEGIVKFINPSEPSKTKVRDIADYRKPIESQKEMKSPLQKLMVGEQHNEIAFG